ncbi:30680_t:CDS:1, partial [Gigaspora margarita]
SNYNLDHKFENKFVKTLNKNGLIANIIECNSKDFGIDIIATYKDQIILIQYKNVEQPIYFLELQKIELSFKYFEKEIVKIIVYNSKKLKNSLTK